MRTVSGVTGSGSASTFRLDEEGRPVSGISGSGSGSGTFSGIGRG